MTSRFLLAALAFTLASVGIIACDATIEPQSDESPITEKTDGGAGGDASATTPDPSSSSSSSSGGVVDAGAAAAPCTVTFTKNVLPALDKAGCGSLTCHGTRFGKDPRIEVGDADFTYKALLAKKIASKDYVKPSSRDPNDSAMHCHMHGECGVKMPPSGGTVPQELVTAVDTWLACGAPK